jgi:H+-transporting ATPase
MADFVIISLSTDNVKWSAKPSRWNINGLAKTGIVIGLLMALEAFSLLYIGLYYFNLSADNQALNTFCLEILLFFSLFSIFVVREKKHFWSSAPGKILLLIILADMILGIILSTFGLLGFKAIPLTQTIVVIIFTAFFSLIINDLIKFLLLKRSRENIPETARIIDK